MGDREYFAKAMNEVFFGDPAITESIVSKYFAPDYVQVTDGHTTSYTDFVKHVTHLRSVAATGSIEVVEFLRDGNKIADRHVGSGTFKGDPGIRKYEVFLFGELDENGEKLAKVVEATKMISGNEGDRDLGRRM